MERVIPSAEKDSQGGIRRPFFAQESGAKCLHNGVLDLIFSKLAPSDGSGTEVLMLEATDLKRHGTASSLNKGV